MQDSFGNPIPDPTADAAPETDAPVVDTPTEAPVTDPAPVDTPAEPVVDTPADPVADAPAEAPVIDTPASEPAPTEAPASVVTPAGGEKKSNSGLIIGIIIAVLVIGIIAAVAVIMMNHKDDGAKKDADSSETKDKEDKKDEKKDDKKDTKKASTGVPITFEDTDITISTSFADTIKSFSKAVDLYEEVDYEMVAIEDIDTYLGRVVEDDNTKIRVNVIDEEEYSIFEINGSTYNAKSGKTTFKDVDLGTIYFWPDEGVSMTIDGHEITIGETTEAKVKEMFGTPDDTYDSDPTYTLDYKIGGIMTTIFFSSADDKGVRTIDFVTFN